MKSEVGLRPPAHRAYAYAPAGSGKERIEDREQMVEDRWHT